LHKTLNSKSHVAKFDGGLAILNEDMLAYPERYNGGTYMRCMKHFTSSLLKGADGKFAADIYQRLVYTPRSLRSKADEVLAELKVSHPKLHALFLKVGLSRLFPCYMPPGCHSHSIVTSNAAEQLFALLKCLEVRSQSDMFASLNSFFYALVAMREKQRHELNRQAAECAKLGAAATPKPLLQGLVSTLRNASVLRATQRADGSFLIVNHQKGTQHVVNLDAVRRPGVGKDPDYDALCDCGMPSVQWNSVCSHCHRALIFEGTNIAPFEDIAKPWTTHAACVDQIGEQLGAITLDDILQSKAELKSGGCMLNLDIPDLRLHQGKSKIHGLADLRKPSCLETTSLAASTEQHAVQAVCPSVGRANHGPNHCGICGVAGHKSSTCSLVTQHLRGNAPATSMMWAPRPGQGVASSTSTGGALPSPLSSEPSQSSQSQSQSQSQSSMINGVPLAQAPSKAVFYDETTGRQLFGPAHAAHLRKINSARGPSVPASLPPSCPPSPPSSDAALEGDEFYDPVESWFAYAQEFLIYTIAEVGHIPPGYNQSTWIAPESQPGTFACMPVLRICHEVDFLRKRLPLVDAYYAETWNATLPPIPPSPKLAHADMTVQQKVHAVVYYYQQLVSSDIELDDDAEAILVGKREVRGGVVGEKIIGFEDITPPSSPPPPSPPSATSVPAPTYRAAPMPLAMDRECSTPPIAPPKPPPSPPGSPSGTEEDADEHQLPAWAVVEETPQLTLRYVGSAPQLPDRYTSSGAPVDKRRDGGYIGFDANGRTTASGTYEEIAAAARNVKALKEQRSVRAFRLATAKWQHLARSELARIAKERSGLELMRCSHARCAFATMRGVEAESRLKMAHASKPFRTIVDEYVQLHNLTHVEKISLSTVPIDAYGQLGGRHYRDFFDYHSKHATVTARCARHEPPEPPRTLVGSTAAQVGSLPCDICNGQHMSKRDLKSCIMFRANTKEAGDLALRVLCQLPGGEETVGVSFKYDLQTGLGRHTTLSKLHLRWLHRPHRPLSMSSSQRWRASRRCRRRRLLAPRPRTCASPESSRSTSCRVESKRRTAGW
jgi:hypothetical protein